MQVLSLSVNFQETLSCNVITLHSGSTLTYDTKTKGRQKKNVTNKKNIDILIEFHQSQDLVSSSLL